LCLNAISFNEKGKNQIIQDGCVLKVCEKLRDSEENVRVAITFCLASLAQLKQGKVEMLDNNQFNTIWPMLNE
jgi:chromatin segregation and condensation protein Rec8/ScpA/Scc1 (kleisin family)